MISQLIVLGLSPIFSRLYSPSDFGSFYSYLSAYSLLFIVSRFNYDSSILKVDRSELPLLNKQAILQLLILLFSIAVVLFLLIAFNLSSWYWLCLIPALLGNTLLWWYYAWELREKNKIQNMKLRISDAGVQSAFRFLVLIPMMLSDFLLIYIQSFYTFFIFGIKRFRDWLSSIVSCKNEFRWNWSWFKENLKMISAQGANVGAFQLPILCFSAVYSLELVGFVGLAMRMVRMPIAVFGTAASDQFKSDFSSFLRENKKDKAKQLFNKNLRELGLLSLIVFLLLQCFAPFMFALVFGENWRMAGDIAQILAMPFALALLIGPLSSIFYLLNKTGVQLRIQFIQLGLILVLIMGLLAMKFEIISFSNWDFQASIWTLSSIYLIGYVLMFLEAKKVLNDWK